MEIILVRLYNEPASDRARNWIGDATPKGGKGFFRDP